MEVSGRPEHEVAETSVFRNGKTAGLFMIVFLCAAYFVSRQGVMGYLALLVALYCLWAALMVVLGVVLAKGCIFLPRSASTSLPFLVFGRRRRAIAELEEITYLGKLLGTEWVVFRFSDERYPAPFGSRDKRLAFFESIRAQKPSIRIYRAH
ncbi:hypothetical protein M2323_004588 [Rhodoblastus acidophilus]|uniref:hypothetical protein n=1 Tax=Rhodoblastus acidophilus TaxID=1074 RepID=UPI002224ED11|nr:hypothetical protein [Rhodoblastus acidophilus]MCW2283826.1 hypothetical protein [Rhodoblastus acidophilus]MCW2335636.1 hypothetical protein [Rhodoblastus acidophilus]